MTTDDLEKTNLMNKLVELSATIIKKIEPINEQENFEFNSESKIPNLNEKAKQAIQKELSQRDHYVIDTFEYAANILNVFEKINKITLFLNEIKPLQEGTKQLNKNEILTYHINNYLIRIVTIRDLLSLLTNQVYQLEIDDRDCNFSLIFEDYSEEIDKKYIDFLKNFCNNGLNNIPNVRNVFIHEGVPYQSENMKMMELFNLVEKNKVIVDMLFSKSIQEQKKFINKNNIEIKKAIIISFDYLYEPFLETYKNN